MVSGTEWLHTPLFRPPACCEPGGAQDAGVGATLPQKTESTALLCAGFRRCCWECWCHFESGSSLQGPIFPSLEAFRIISLLLCCEILQRHALDYRSSFIYGARKRAVLFSGELSVLPFWKFPTTLKMSFPRCACSIFLEILLLVYWSSSTATFFFSLPFSHLFDCLFNSVFGRLTQLYLPTFLSVLC